MAVLFQVTHICDSYFLNGACHHKCIPTGVDWWEYKCACYKNYVLGLDQHECLHPQIDECSHNTLNDCDADPIAVCVNTR